MYSTVVTGSAVFINPPPYPQAGYDLAASPSYALGSTLDIKWTMEPQGNVSLALFQLSGTTPLYPYENVFSMFLHYLEATDMNIKYPLADPITTDDLDTGVTSFLWKAHTEKDLSFSNNFWMCLFPGDTTHAVSCTNFFNITSTDAGIEASSTTGSGLTTQTRVPQH